MASSLPFRRIMVTGGDGFVGGHLLPRLAEAVGSEAAIILASRVPVTDSPYGQVAFELSDRASVDAALAEVRPDLIVHLAAQASVGQSAGQSGATWTVNLVGSLWLAEAIAHHAPLATLLYVSSAEVYGRSFNEGIADENSALRPQSAYARSKAAAEGMFHDLLPADARLIVTRPSNHSGVGQDERFVIPAFAAQIARIERGEAREVRVGNLDARRNFMDVRDVVSAYLALLAAGQSLPARAVYNIASGESVRIGELLERLCAMSPADMPIVEDPQRMRPSEVPCAALDARALREATGWQPAYSLDDMLGAVLSDQRRLS